VPDRGSVPCARLPLAAGLVMDVTLPLEEEFESAPSSVSPPPLPRKLKWTDFAGRFAGRAINPAQWVKAVRLQRGRKAHRHTFDDAQLALYAKILPSDFLHYGYFDDPQVRPEEMSLADVARAQERYAELLLDLAGDVADPVLDVGCGMGGLCRMLRDRRYKPVALTPDRLQASHIAATLPDVPLIRCKFEALPAEAHRAAYGTVITSESLQYLKLAQALPILQAVLKPGGRWVACDYFHVRPSNDRSCHVWDEFTARVADAGWRIASQRDVTAHVLPMLGYIHMWATRFGVPLMQFAFLRLRRKQPALHHLAGGVIELLEGLAAKNVDLIDPAQFARHKRYMLCALERA
jgi:cyclopropane fatty-acyl-phospholipid synthase-like methyltransferase